VDYSKTRCMRRSCSFVRPSVQTSHFMYELCLNGLVNRQIGVEDSKYGVGGDPLYTGHMTQSNFPAKTAYNGDAHQ